MSSILTQFLSNQSHDWQCIGPIIVLLEHYGAFFHLENQLSSQHILYCCALRLWSQLYVICRGFWFLGLVALILVVLWQDASSPAACVRNGFGAFRQQKF